MMLLFGDPNATQTITVLRAGQRDWGGDREQGYTDHHTIDGVLVDVEDTSAEKFRQDEYQFRGTLLMPIGSDVLPTDLIELADGERVVVFGKPRVISMGIVRGISVKFRSRTADAR